MQFGGHSQFERPGAFAVHAENMDCPSNTTAPITSVCDSMLFMQQTRTVFQHDGPNHLGIGSIRGVPALRHDALLHLYADTHHGRRDAVSPQAAALGPGGVALSNSIALTHPARFSGWSNSFQ